MSQNNDEIVNAFKTLDYEQYNSLIFGVCNFVENMHEYEDYTFEIRVRLVLAKYRRFNKTHKVILKSNIDLSSKMKFIKEEMQNRKIKW